MQAMQVTDVHGFSHWLASSIPIQAMPSGPKVGQIDLARCSEVEAELGFRMRYIDHDQTVVECLYAGELMVPILKVTMPQVRTN